MSAHDFLISAFQPSSRPRPQKQVNKIILHPKKGEHSNSERSSSFKPPIIFSFPYNSAESKIFRKMFSWSRSSHTPDSAPVTAFNGTRTRLGPTISRNAHLSSYLGHHVLKQSTRKVSPGKM